MYKENAFIFESKFLIVQADLSCWIINLCLYWQAKILTTLLHTLIDSWVDIPRPILVISNLEKDYYLSKVLHKLRG